MSWRDAKLSRRKSEGVDLWAETFGLALEGFVEEGVDCVGKIAIRGRVCVCEIQ